MWLLLLTLPIAAQSAEVFVPAELQGWQDWVLHNQEHRDCPFYFNSAGTERENFVCAWPGILDVTVDADSGRFTQQWTVYAKEAWLPLPGDSASGRTRSRRTVGPSRLSTATVRRVSDLAPAVTRWPVATNGTSARACCAYRIKAV